MLAAALALIAVLIASVIAWLAIGCEGGDPVMDRERGEG